MSITLEPSDVLEFRRPFTTVVKEILRISNPNAVPVAFKVKTTAPKRYCVRPNAGKVEANSAIDVQVLLQAMEQDPPEDFKCKDKFLVQSTPMDGSMADMSITDLWHTIETEQKGRIAEKKIRCSFLPALNGTANPIENRPSHQETAPSSGAALTNGSSTPQENGRADSVHSQKSALAPSVASNEESNDALKARLVSANSTIQRLQYTLQKLETELEAAKADDQGLRRRNVGSTEDNSSATPAAQAGSSQMDVLMNSLTYPPPPEGYPPQLVALVALIVFIFTWLFF